MQGPQGKLRWTNAWLCHERTIRIVTTIVTGSSSRLANQHLRGFLQLLTKLRLLLGKVNDGTLSGYKHLPSALTKWLVQVHVWRFSRRFVRLTTWTQRLSSLLFFTERAKVINDTFCWTCWSNLESNSIETYYNSILYLTHCPLDRSFYLVDQ